MTDAQIAANRKSAGNLVRYQLGLDTIAESDWTYEQRTAFNKALATYIADHPSAFSQQDVLTAGIVQQNTYQPLEDASFSTSDFLSTTAANAAAPFKAIGDGIITTATAARWAIPVIVGVVVIMALVAANRKFANA